MPKRDHRRPTSDWNSPMKVSPPTYTSGIFIQTYILTLVIVATSALTFKGILTGSEFIALIGPITGFHVGKQRTGIRETDITNGEGSKKANS